MNNNNNNISMPEWFILTQQPMGGKGMVKQVIYSTCRFSLLGSLSDDFELQFFRDSFHFYTTVGIACRAIKLCQIFKTRRF